MSRSAPTTEHSVWRAPGMPALLLLTAAGFAGYAALLPVVPLWAVEGGSGAAGSGLVNGILLLATVLAQGFVPTLLTRLGTGRVLAAGLALLGVPALLHLISDQLPWILTLSVIRGLGFAILTVTGSAAVAHLVPSARHGAAIGAFGAAIAVPQLLLLPAGPWLADAVGFWAVFILGTFPLLGIGAAPRLAAVLREHEKRRGGLRTDADQSDSQDPSDAAGPAADVGPRPTARLIRPMILLLGVTLAGGALITFAPQISSVPAATTGGLTLLTATAALSRWRFGAWADRFGSRPFLWPLVVVTAAGLALASIAVHDADATDVALFLVAMALAGLSYGGLQNLTLVMSRSAVRPEQYGTASAAWNIGFDAGTGLGSVLVGAIAAGLSFPAALLVAAAIPLATLPLALLRGRMAPSSSA